MSMIPEDLKYASDHEWVRAEDRLARVGITDFAQEQLGDIVFVELPARGAKLTPGKAFGIVESVKAASDVFSPVTGTVSLVNPKLADEPELVNSDPYGEGWMLVIELADAAELDGLMTADAYKAMLADEGA